MIASSPTPNNLPSALSSFVGRSAEVAHVKHLLANTRLLCLTGTGGIGKSRLALQVASELLSVFDEGVWWVDFASISNPAFVTSTTLNALGLIEQSAQNPIQLMIEFFRDKSVLLVLENCEHLRKASAELAEALLRQSPNLHLLVTSQEPFNLAGEKVWIVPPLGFPEDPAEKLPALQNYDAVQLFVERAQAVRSDFSLTPQNISAVAQICQHLSGLPLAIELAAARITILSPEQIARRLTQGLDLLNYGKSLAPQRQRSLRATLDWSYGLLSETEKILLRRLSVFEGGFTLEAAESICSGEGLALIQTLDSLSSLANKSLLTVQQNKSQARYRLLEPIRQYASERLDEAQETRQMRERHLTFFVEWVGFIWPKSFTAEQVICFEEIEGDLDNLRCALTWASANQPLSGLRLVQYLTGFWNNHGLASEGRRWGEALLHSSASAESPEIIRARARAITAIAFLAMTQGENQLAADLVAQALPQLRKQNDPLGLMVALSVNASACSFLGHWGLSEAAAEESLSISDEIQEMRGRPAVLGLMAQLMFRRGENAKGQYFMEQALVASHRLGAPTALAISHWAIGTRAAHQGELATAHDHFIISVKHFREVGDKHRINMATSALANVLRQMGQWEKARKLYQETIEGWRAYGQMGGIARCLECMAFIELAESRSSLAARWLGSAEVLREAANSQMIPFEKSEYEHELNTLRQRLSEEVLRRSWNEGRTQTLDQTLLEIRTLVLESEANSPLRPPAQPQSSQLTPREHEVLQLLAEGLSDTQIAEKLVISRRTVTTHLTTVYSKFGVKSRSAAIRYALDHQLV